MSLLWHFQDRQQLIAYFRDPTGVWTDRWVRASAILNPNKEMNKLQLGFHTTFAFRKAEVARLLGLAARPGGLPVSAAALVSETGFGTKKVGPVKSWAIRAGLIEGNAVTEAGRVIFEADPFLRSKTSEWLMHFNLSFGSNGFEPPPPRADDWGGWPYFIFDFLPSHPEFTLETLVRAAESVFDDPYKLLKANFPYLLRAYTDLDALSGCAALAITPQGSYRLGAKELPPNSLIAYLLSKLWQRDFGETESVLTSDVREHHMGLAPLLCVSRLEFDGVLDRLSGDGYVEQRRTVAPYQLVRRWGDSTELLKRAFQNDR